MSLWIVAGNTGHALAAALLTSLAILTSRRSLRSYEGQILVVALTVTALWSLRHALASVLNIGALSDGVAETVRNGAWLGVMTIYMHRHPVGGSLGRVRPLVLLSLAQVLVIQLGFDLLVGEGAPVNEVVLPVFQSSWLLRCTFALGALVLLHGMSTQRDHPAAARRQAWVGAGLAFMWAYDFNHYALAWLTDGRADSIGPMRGFVMALFSLMLVLGLRADDGTRALALSRAVTMRLVSLGILALYLIVVTLLATLSSGLIAPVGRVVQFGVLFALAVSVLALMPSTSLRAWLRVEITKHLFAHRYDYRMLWMRFAATVGENGTDEAPLETRVTRAIAEAIEAPSAALYLRDEDGRLSLAKHWCWPVQTELPGHLPAVLADRLLETAWIVDLAADWATYGAMLPAWMQRSAQTWALAPLIHADQLVGVILLAAPPGNRRLDWEDLDVLRVVCWEAAARLGEARSRAALAEAQRFDEFNRRFAFILHDLKNLVSQMSLLASNAERHADNPAFREDMVLTLKETASRMTELLQRLGRPGSRAEAKGLLLGPWARDLVASWAAGLGLVEVDGDVMRPVRADAEGLSRAIGHLVRNAIEASPAGRLVWISLSENALGASIRVTDRGHGMSEAFMRDQLFRPFSSTKPTGFGLGAHEARLLVQTMGGMLDVESIEGQGTTFTIRLPFADIWGSDASSEQTRKTG
ncbi:XrtA/PEP-CTERM system histidine kinase PrsK [Sphingobium nicotianae]|uniref:histidine kinase n=1 Tax=Sphingobium nicotianae TaxID=2782607 RepID=A0A9X1AJP1_9SPHN|nr:XrtA/PEP-CTERM system histidine kinase PrsK [Sphingobium nicotianae]MBT2185739.1 PEP-CTERM system histidine kinase PrsK [Sphingobium nicotianae]